MARFWNLGVCPDKNDKIFLHNLINKFKSRIMNTSNSPLASTSESQIKPKSFKNAIIGALSVVIIALGGYMVYNNSNNSKLIKQEESKVTSITAEKSDLQTSFDASLSRLDSMSTVTNSLQAELTEKNSEITKAKDEIRKILNNKNASVKELARAKTLISNLNEKIAGMQEEVARLTQENQVLAQDKVVLTADKEKLTEDLVITTSIKKELEQKVDIASTLNASNIVISPVNVKRNGKEKISSTAKRVDKLNVSFDLVNRIVQPGTADVYVVVMGPDGKPISAGTAGLFSTREGADKSYTAKLPVDLETAKTKNVNFSFTPGDSFQTGNYKIQIYQNGFLIGEGTKELKKGGLFS